MDLIINDVYSLKFININYKSNLDISLNRINAAIKFHYNSPTNPIYVRYLSFINKYITKFWFYGIESIFVYRQTNTLVIVFNNKEDSYNLHLQMLEHCYRISQINPTTCITREVVEEQSVYIVRLRILEYML